MVVPPCLLPSPLPSRLPSLLPSPLPSLLPRLMMVVMMVEALQVSTRLPWYGGLIWFTVPGHLGPKIGLRECQLKSPRVHDDLHMHMVTALLCPHVGETEQQPLGDLLAMMP